MAIADWEQLILNAFAQTGEQAPSYLSNYDSPWETGGTAGLQGVVDGTYGQGQLPGGGIVGGYGGAIGDGTASLPPPVNLPGYGPAPTNGGGTAPTNNPNMQGQIDYLRQQSDFALGQNLNSIRSNSVGNGGLGGSRQGVAQGVATGLANQGYTGNVANMLSTDWQNQQNRNLTQYGMDQNFYTAQRGQDQSGAALGANLVGLGTQLPWTGINGANSTYGQYTGFGNTTNTSQSGGGMQGLLGGALGGAQMAKAWGWI